jgi:hypothetical protein
MLYRMKFDAASCSCYAYGSSAIGIPSIDLRGVPEFLSTATTPCRNPTRGKLACLYA